jgi:hypothetical protein
MRPSSSRSRRRSAWRAVGLAALLLPPAALAAPRLPAAAKAGRERGSVRRLSMVIAGIGDTKVPAVDRSAAVRDGTVYYYVGVKETVVIQVAGLTGPMPPPVHLYPLVRRQGEEVWTVQPEATGSGGRRRAGEWRAEVHFAGEPGVRFELEVLAAAEALSRGPLPEGTRAQEALAESAIVRVERRRGKPAVAIAAVAGQGVYGSMELMVHEQDQVGVTARDVPAESQVGVAVQPAGTGRTWVMPEAAGGSGDIQATFGSGDGSELSFHYLVSTFVAPQRRWPPVGRGLSAAEWQPFQAGFLARSRAIPVVRWQRQLEIEQIGRMPVAPGRVFAVDRQVDLRGAARRPLTAGEKVWVLCIPLQGDPWVAAWTPRLTPSGHWWIQAVPLQMDGKPDTFDVVAVVSADDALQVQPGALRKWLHDVESEDRSTRITIAAASARPRPPRASGRRPR